MCRPHAFESSDEPLHGRYTLIRVAGAAAVFAAVSRVTLPNLGEIRCCRPSLYLHRYPEEARRLHACCVLKGGCPLVARQEGRHLLNHRHCCLIRVPAAGRVRFFGATLPRGTTRAGRSSLPRLVAQLVARKNGEGCVALAIRCLRLALVSTGKDSWRRCNLDHFELQGGSGNQLQGDAAVLED